MVEKQPAMNGRAPKLGLSEFIYGASTFVMANLLWVLCSLPLVTLPTATGALFAVLAPWARGQSVDSPLTTFFPAMRRYWLKSTAVVLIDLVAAGFIGLNLLILRQMGLDDILALLALGLNLSLAGTVIITNVYIWPLMVTLDTSLRELLKNGIKLALAHPFWGLLTAVLASLPLFISILLPGFFLLTVSFATAALIINWGAWRIIRRYLNQDEIKNLGV